MPQDLSRILEKFTELVEKQGLDGQKIICKYDQQKRQLWATSNLFRAMTDLKTCLGDQYDTCISEDYLTSIGVKPESAYLTVRTASKQIYTCTTCWDGKLRSYVNKFFY